MKTKVSVIVFATAVMLSGCVHSNYVKPAYPALQQAYIEKVMASPLEVNIKKSQIEDAWGRTQAFIAKYSDLKIQTVSDYSIQTYNSYRIFMYGYTAIKTPAKDGFTITVNCISANSLSRSTREKMQDALDLNAHIFSYYVETGELPFPELIDTLSRHQRH
jgi:hypothetical protein